jgi:ferrous iron transport protein A
VETLNELKPGQKCVVEKVDTSLDIKRRLMDLGVVKNAEIECAMISPGGDPKAFYIKGALIALRKEDSSKIAVRICDKESDSDEKGWGE